MAVGPYLRRRWRAVGFVLVLMAATALYALITDRGHDAAWEAEVPGAEVVAAAPDASRVYVLTKANGTVRDLVALDAEGREAWRRPVPGDSPDAVLEATAGLVAVATAARPVAAADAAPPGARLLVFSADDGALRLNESLPFTARALAIEPGLLAVAVQLPAQRYPVLLWRNLTPAGTIAVNESVETLDVEKGVLALGTSRGRIVVVDPNGTEVMNATRGYAVLQVRLDAAAQFLAAGGKEFSGGGRVEFYRLRDPVPDLPRWENLTTSEVRYLDLSRDGGRLLALASPPGTGSLLYLFDTASGSSPLRVLQTGGVVHRQGTSTAAGARLSPDGSLVAFGTLTGAIVLYDFSGPEPVRRWQHDAAGTTSLAFPAEAPRTLLADASYDPKRGTDRVLRLDADGEPLAHDLSRIIPLALAVEALVGAALLAVGYLRRPAR